MNLRRPVLPPSAHPKPTPVNCNMKNMKPAAKMAAKAAPAVKGKGKAAVAAMKGKKMK